MYENINPYMGYLPDLDIYLEFKPFMYPKNPDPFRKFVGLMVETSHPQNRIAGEIPSDKTYKRTPRVFYLQHNSLDIQNPPNVW